MNTKSSSFVNEKLIPYVFEPMSWVDISTDEESVLAKLIIPIIPLTGG